MRTASKAALVVILAAGFYFLAGLPLDKVCAQQYQQFFQKDTNYEIHYALEDSAQYITNVKIKGIVEINGIAFLEIQPSNFAQDKSGYILFSSIRTILPTGGVRPQGISTK